MERHYSDKYLETYYTKTLDNGLKIVLFHREDYDKSFFLVGTPFGALDMMQKDEEGKVVEYPAGIAHFLEHKMFADPKGDVMERFSGMGVQVNAFTSYGETVYYFSSNDGIEEPLHLLLDFTHELFIDDASVEKEKGIIIEELNMYAQQSDSRLLHEVFRSLYHNHPLKYDIGGDEASVSSTTTEQLYECFHLNYATEKKVLVGVCSENPEEVLRMIEENQASKAIVKRPLTKRILTLDEPDEVVRKDYVFEMDVNTSKVSIAYKFKGYLSGVQRSKDEWALRFGLDSLFSALNPEYQIWMDEGIINDYFSYEVELGEDFAVLLFSTETTKKADFITLVQSKMEVLQSTLMDSTMLEQLKRRYFGQSISALNSFENTAIYFLRNDFADVDFFQSLDLLEDISVEDVKIALKRIPLENHVVVEVQPLND